MSTSAGENEMGLKKILDFTRLTAIAILLLHFYYYCYSAFKSWDLTSAISDRLLRSIMDTGLFNRSINSKLISIALLCISLVGTRGKKDEKLNPRTIISMFLGGLVIYFSSIIVFKFQASHETVATSYMAATAIGFLLVLSNGTLITRVIKLRLSNDIFNEVNESFPQEERCITNEYSVNLPARYLLKKRIRNSWINIINPFRGLLVVGSPGSGKSWFVIQHVIKQHIEKGFAMFVYDFKYDDLTKIAYNWLLQHKSKYETLPSFYVINFDDLSVSHRCNPLDPASMQDITDATESARTILLGLNREWIDRQGDFLWSRQ